MTKPSTGSELQEAVDTIESVYEFLLAYAAQGRHTDRDTAGAEGPRARLEAMANAIAMLPGLARSAAARGPADSTDTEAFFAALERDAAASAAAIRLVLGARDLSSQLVDNLNASIHLRALLTDVFLLDAIES